MREKRFNLRNLSLPLLDVDLMGGGRWVALVGDARDQLLAFNEKVIRLPRFVNSCLVRAVGTRALVVERRPRRGDTANAWIISADGKVRGSFLVGEGVADGFVTGSYIVIAYHEDGYYSSFDVSHEGLAVFDLSGRYLYGYNSAIADHAGDVTDCYCACRISLDGIAFLREPVFHLVELDVSRRTQTVTPTPDAMHQALALTELDGVYFVHCPHTASGAIFRFSKESREVSQVGAYSKELRGLGRGRFLAKDESGFTLISMG